MTYAEAVAFVEYANNNATYPAKQDHHGYGN